MTKKKLNAKLSLNAQSLRLLTKLDRIAGGLKPESRGTECFSRDCTHDMFCPTGIGACV